MFFQIVVVVMLGIILYRLMSLSEILIQMVRNQSSLADIYSDFFKSLKIDRIEKK
jgi:hypothetical protein